MNRERSMNKIYTILLLATSLLSAEVQFSSDEVISEGSEITLSGHVFIKHDFGTLSANKATLTQSSGANTPSFLSACLNSCVEIKFSSNQTLQSENALINFVDNTASLSSDDRQIFFFDPDRQITIQSQKIDCEWEGDQKDPKIKALTAQKSVQISLGSDIFIHAEEAIYAPSMTNNQYGTLTLNGSTNHKPCLISIGEDLLKADSVTIEMESETLILHKPIGKIATKIINMALPEEIFFTSKTLSWNRKTGEIVLTEQILIDGAEFGHLIAHDRVFFSTDIVDEKVLFKGFEAVGESTLTTTGGMSITCDGNIDFNYETKSLLASAGMKPLIYQNGDLVIESKKLTFDKVEGSPNVISFFDDVNFSAGAMLGKAGGLTYKPSEHILNFFSSGEENVVFYNKESDTKMSATAITITRDPVTEENIIQGHGVVKLTFDHKNREQIIEVLNSCVKHPF